MIKAIIFDFDGVIIDSYGFNLDAMISVFKQKGLNFTADDFKRIFFGRTLREGLHVVLKPLNRLDELNDFFELKKQHDKYFGEKVKVFPDALEFIKNNKLRKMIATGARPIHVNLTLEHYNLKGKFEFAITAEDTTKGKPNPEIYFMALKKLGLPADECVVIEDTPVGISAAKAAGIKCVAVTNTFPKDRLQEADLIVDKLTDDKVRKFIG